MEVQVQPAVNDLLDSFVGVNWGSSNFRAYRIAADGTLLDEWSQASGVSGLGRDGMAKLMNQLSDRWPNHGSVYACGMVGSNIGWQEAPYVEAPSNLKDVARASVGTMIGSVPVRLVPGICCEREFDGGPDILRGEEIELFGLASIRPDWSGLVALPGTHTKWARFQEGRITEFFTSMSGEIFDKLTTSGLLASIVEGEATDGPEFLEGVRHSHEHHLRLGTLLFGARARVIRGLLERKHSASYLRGLLIGSEIADALTIYPQLKGNSIPLIGNSIVCKMYASALTSLGVRAWIVDSREACLAGFRALHVASIS
jgi:2-dehydro-3-deoxygalactonokinase